MACEMPNNPIRLANSNSGETPCEPISAGFGGNYELMTEAEVIHFLSNAEEC
jgi:hypothetical protein